MLTYYRNETLFSEIYLEGITQQPEQAEVLASLNVLSEYRQYADSKDLVSWRDSYVHEVLSALGFYAQAKSEHLTLLFPMGSDRQETPLSLCYVVSPAEDLNNTTMGRNWAEKIIRSLRQANLQWGLLTNGKNWRIYHLDEPTPYETYLEIDLDSILNEKARDAYQIFHTFMKASNFVMGTDGQCQFDHFKKESQDKITYIEQELANALKQREEGGKGVLSDICLGYVEALRAERVPDFDDEMLRKKIYHAAMLYMFRLLFLFYAEARNLLSDENSATLEEAKQLSQAYLKSGQVDQSTHRLWTQLETIFVDIDQTYNGGLFSPQESEFTQFLSDTRIADRYLAGVLLNLTTYREKNGEEKPISYRDMGVRHLGTLYEGLLEHQLFIAQEDTEVRVSKAKVKFVPASQGGKLVLGQYIKAGEVYFAGDPSERKSSGSYFTPEYIVDYIVSKTVGTKLEELQQIFLESETSTINALDSAIDAEERNSLTALLAENLSTFIQTEILNLSVLDPAMGSGHFLVNAGNRIANFITAQLNTFDLTSDLETSTGYWRRWVVENCLFGVDINPLAVELAKLSLWILSMAKDQPLSFINHHLKCGNSLIGARLDEIGIFPRSSETRQPKQLSLFDQDPDFKAAIENVINKSHLITAKGSTSLEDIKAKRDWLEDINRLLEGYKAICDVHTSLYYGNELDQSQYQKMIDEKDFQFAQSVNIANQYFHWELEFPDILLSRGGFTVITCNPPYDTIKEDAYFKNQAVAGCGNLFGHFISKAILINNQGGSIGFIVPLSLACGSSFEKVRKAIYQNYRSLYTSHYSKRPNMLFDGVQQRITIFFSHAKTKTNHCQVYSSKLWRWKKPDQENVVKYPGHSFIDNISESLIPKVGSQVGAEIYLRIKNAPKKLNDIFVKDCNAHSIAYYHSVAMYWIKAYDFLPYFKREHELNKSMSSKLKAVHFSNTFDKDLFILIINSSLFYYWWIAQGDEFDVRVSEIIDFGLLGYDGFKSNQRIVSELVLELMTDYKKHSEIKSTSLGGSRCFYQEFYPRQSRHIINQIDDFIAPIYGLTDTQNQFLKEYDLIWRTDRE
ncbi:MAG: DNA methyltransferase [Anaerolineaceae bacterium]